MLRESGMRKMAARQRTWLIIAVAACGGVWMLGSSRLTAQAPGGGPPPAAVAVAVAVERPMADSRAFVGTLMPVQRSIVGSAVDGRVIDFPVTEGDWVEKGQPLCRLLTRTVEIEIASAEAELKLRQQEFQEMKSGSRPEEIAFARAKLEEARAARIFTQDKLQRTHKLFESRSSVSREELDQAMSQATAADQLFIAAQANYAMAEKGPRQERVMQAQARMEAAQEQVNLLNDRLEKYTIKAPFNGYVVAEHTEQGEWMKSGNPVVDLVAIDPIEVTVSVPENYIGGVQASVAEYEERQEAAPADVRIEALGPQPFSGRIVRIVPQADLKSRTFPVKVHVANPVQGRSHLLKAGMLAHVTLPTGQPQQSTLVPKDALVLGGPSPQVLVVATNPQTKGLMAKAVPVETGLSEGDWIQVKGEVRAGQQVVIRGNERIRDGQPVQVISTMAATEKGG